MARVDKSAATTAAVVEETRTRRSTSSVPRGRSSSPSEFTKVLSDLRKNSNTRVSAGPLQKRVNRSGSSEGMGEKCDIGKRVLKDTEKTRRTLDGFEGNFRKSERVEIGVVNNGANERKERNFGSIVSSDLDENYSESVKVKIRAVNGSNEKKEVNLGSISIKRFSGEKTIERSHLELGVKSVNFQSKLHEKLAFLEGKVKRIACDIKRTKEMLDMNNPHDSKMILSDIQEKISGIEKAMVHVVRNDEETEMGSIKSGENVDNVEDSRSLVKGLNVEELEERLFPHHKLIRDRTLLKTTSLNVDEKVSCLDANAIDLESIEAQEVDDALLMADENLDEFDDEENMVFDEEIEEICTYQLNDIGVKTSTGGWFVSEGESVLLAHDDGSCSFYDIANCEEKGEYKPPNAIPPNIWRDCWIIRAPSADGCSGKYVVSASSGNSIHSGFCSWDFYTKDIRAFHFKDETTHVRTSLAPLPNNSLYRRNAQNQQWWYKPCGPLIVSTGSCQRTVQIYDIRDGDETMKWELQRPVLGMDYVSPLHWRNRGKVVIAELDGVSLWDVNCLSSKALLSVSSSGREISGLHVNNTDSESGGVRQRISSSEAEGNDGFFCTLDSINVLDFRNPSGIGLKIPKVGVSVNSSFSSGDSIYIGCTNLGKKHTSSQIQQFSLRKNKLLTTHALPESNSHHSFKALTQVWGNSNYVMGVCGLGLYVFDSLKDDVAPLDFGGTQNVMEIIGPDDMYSPSFDYLSSRVLVISRDRPACWRYLL